MNVTSRACIEPIIGNDGSLIRELASPHNSPLTRHSLAEIHHPPGTASQEHIHTEAEEVYYVVDGQGKIRINDHTHTLTRGDIVVICPGQRHKVWPQGEEDLVLLVTCAPAYSMDDVVFTEQTP